MRPFKAHSLLRGRIFILALSLVMMPAFAKVSFLTINDIHYGSKNNSQDGQDTGDDLLELALTKFKQLVTQANFILVLGDIPTHTWLFNSKKPEYETKVFHALFEADDKAKPMFYITGNNDSFGGNYQPFEYEGKSPLAYATEWKGSCVYCDGLLIDDTSMLSKGYYSSYVMPDQKDIILIALNSNIWAKIPLFAGYYSNQEQDAWEQLDWLEGQLKKLQAKQLIIAMHIPPGAAYNGVLYWHDAYLKRFISLLDLYQDSFGEISLLAAHTHMDELRRIHLKSGKVLYVFLSPSIGRNHHNNSGMKIFNLDNNLKIENYTTYYTSQLSTWENEQYQAWGSTEAVFPECSEGPLALCLDKFNAEQLCAHLEQNSFYGVKSDRVPQNACHIALPVN